MGFSLVPSLAQFYLDFPLPRLSLHRFIDAPAGKELLILFVCDLSS